MRLLAEVLGSRRLGFFVAPNRAFRDTLVEQLARGGREYREDGQALFQSSWSFHAADFSKDRLHEVLVVDEAHRLKDEAYQYRGASMVEDMIRAARISVFLLDETQRVQWNDSGSEERIREAARKFKARAHPPFTLTAQFRCGGSDGYAWEWPTAGQQRRGHARHVSVGRLSLPWNFSGENWATAAEGIDQVGCVHTCQGMEFDWLGVLIGPDLRFEHGRIVGDPGKRARTDSSLKGWKTALNRADGDTAATEAVLAKVQAIIKNTYKVLLSRGRKGCFVGVPIQDCASISATAFASLRTRSPVVPARPRWPPLLRHRRSWRARRRSHRRAALCGVGARPLDGAAHSGRCVVPVSTRRHRQPRRPHPPCAAPRDQ